MDREAKVNQYTQACVWIMNNSEHFKREDAFALNSLSVVVFYEVRIFNRRESNTRKLEDAKPL
jgi:hypothetical protein